MSLLRNLIITDKDDPTRQASVDADGQLHVVLEGQVLDGCSSSTALAASGVFTGDIVDTCKYSLIIVNIFTDVVSATDGLEAQFSSDGVNWDHLDVFTIAAGVGKVFSFQTTAEYFRVVYTNGLVAQTAFRLQTIGKKAYSKPSSHRIADSISVEDDAELVKAVTTAEGAISGAFENIQAVTLSGLSQNIDGATALIVAAQLMGRVTDTLSAPVKLDASTYDLAVISHEHSEVHKGEHFFVSDVTDLALNNVRDGRITTPNTAKWAHFFITVSSESETDLYIYEDVSILTVGTAFTPFNNNRNSANTAELLIDIIDNTSVANANLDTDITGAATLVHSIIGAGKDAGIKTRDVEFVLKQNTTYCIRAVANTAGYVNYDAEWYEHTDKS